MTEHSFNKSNRYQPTRTIEEQSARTTEAILFSLKGATLTMTDALKIAAAARECACCHTASDAANAAEKETESGQ